MSKIQKYVGAAFYMAGLFTVFFGTAISGSFDGANESIVAGAALVLVGYCIQGFKWDPNGNDSVSRR